MADSRDTLAELRAFTQRLRDKSARWDYLQRRMAECAVSRVAPLAEHAPQTRNPLLAPRLHAPPHRGRGLLAP